MPRGDGTGPNGAGPLTGRGAGFCSGSDRPGFARNLFNRLGLGRRLGRGRAAGMGGGRGRGMGRRRW